MEEFLITLEVNNGYTNREGKYIKVTQEHLETAMRIKKELQKASPSLRTNWNLHKKLMEKEGFFDSDTNENYRGLIKRYQRKVGQLPSMAKHAELVSNNQLRSIREEIGELNSRKLAMQETGRTLRKLVRQTNKDALLIEEIGNALSETPFVKAQNVVVLPTFERDLTNDMIVCLSDIHYGAHVDIPENYYGTDVVGNILQEYAERVIALVKKENVGRIDVVNLGDIVEHAYMRNQNLFDSEETLSEQIVNVTKLIINFLQELRNHVEIITYRGIAGNHDRLQGDKKSNLNADHAVNISNQIIKMWIDLSESDIKFVDSDSYFTDISIRGWNFAFVHGDRNSLTKKTTLAELSEQHDKHYDAVIGGHIHHQTMLEVGDNRYQATFGSIKGMDEYSLRLGSKASRSQGVILIDDRNFEIRNIQL